MVVEVSVCVLLSNKSLQNNGTLCCAASDAFCAYPITSSLTRLARSNHFSQKDTGGPSCTIYATLTPMRMEAELIAFLWQQPRPKIPAVSEFRTSRPSSRNASVVRDAFMPLPDSIHCQAQTPTGSLPDIYSVAHSSFRPSLIPVKVGCFPAVGLHLFRCCLVSSASFKL